MALGSFFDQLGRAVALDAPARRVVSLVPSHTELLAELGLDAEVVGITDYCARPADWRGRKARVGGPKRIDAPRIDALAPDLVLADKE
ncbi:MAG: helical backbone metal receptor, partial [Candidatus Polarisedimenticolia bacterium]